MSDIVLLQEEVNSLISTAQANGLENSAIHNHFFYEEPRIIYVQLHGMGDVETMLAAAPKIICLHYYGRGQAATLAKGPRAALSEFEKGKAMNIDFEFTLQKREIMNKISIIAISALAVVVAVAGGAGFKSTDESSYYKSVVPTETPAPLQEKGKTLSYNFDNDAAGNLPAKFHEALTGKGSPGKWEVKADSTAPSAPNILAQASADKTNNRFPLAIADEGSFADLDLSVKFKPIRGNVDQAAGLVWRLKDANNYYIVRANALENNVVLYKVEDGKRSDLPLVGKGKTYGAKAPVPKNQWSELRVVAVGKIFTVYMNGEKLYEVEDETFREAGKIGLWTKADSVTYFDDLRVTAK